MQNNPKPEMKNNENKPSQAGRRSPPRKVYGMPAVGRSQPPSQVKKGQTDDKKADAKKQDKSKEKASRVVNVQTIRDDTGVKPEVKVAVSTDRDHSKADKTFLFKLGMRLGRWYTKAKNKRNIKKQEKKIEQQKKKERREGVKKPINTKKATTALSFCFSVLFLLFAITILYLYRPFPVDDGIPSQITMYYVFEGGKHSKDVSGKKVIRENGEIYVNMTDIYPELGMSAMGDLDSMRYSLGNGDYMILENNSELVVMNGENIVLPGKVYVEDKNVYAPVALFRYYIKGVDIFYNTELERLTVTRTLDLEKSNSVKKVYVEFEFLLHNSFPLTPIPEPDI